MAIHGFCAPRFAAVREAFAANFEHHGDVGAACTLYYRGQVAVDLWGGLADHESERRWEEDTAAVVFSSTKGVTAACAAMLAARRRLDLDAPIAAVWPEFAHGGKGAIALRHVLAHQAGLPVIEGDFTLEQALAWDPVVAQLARQTPLWEPGSAHGYHVRSYGWLAGEVFRRAASVSVGRFLAAEVARPLGLELWIGLPEAEERRVARMIPPVPPADPAMRELLDRFMGPDTLTGRAMTGPSNLFHYDEMWNTRPLHAVELPSSNGIATARGLARFYAALIGEVDGIRLLDEVALDAVRALRSDGPDRILHLPTRFGSGVMLPPVLSPSASPGAFGHPGAGGSLGLADPEAGLAIGYAMSAMQLGLTGDKRSHGLVAAAYASLG